MISSRSCSRTTIQLTPDEVSLCKYCTYAWQECLSMTCQLLIISATKIGRDIPLVILCAFVAWTGINLSVWQPDRALVAFYESIQVSLDSGDSFIVKLPLSVEQHRKRRKQTPLVRFWTYFMSNVLGYTHPLFCADCVEYKFTKGNLEEKSFWFVGFATGSSPLHYSESGLVENQSRSGCGDVEKHPIPVRK